MADTKISALTADTAPTQDDLLVTVTDPAGTPANRKVTIADLTVKQDATDTWANRPSAAWSGRRFLPSNGVMESRDTGAAWASWGPLFPFAEPVSGDFAWINQGAAAITTTFGGVCLGEASAGGLNWRVRKKAAPSAPYTITAAFTLALEPGGVCQAGILWRQSSDGKLVIWNLYTSSGDLNYTVEKYSSPTSFSASYVVAKANGLLLGPVVWFRLEDDATNRKCHMSSDGQNWMQIHTIGRTDFMTADEVGFAIQPSTAAGRMTLLSWKEA